MRAIRVHEFGGPDVLRLEEVRRPEPAADELLIDVEAASVNPIDWIVRYGDFDEPLRAPLPWIPGWDVSGVVERTGGAVTAFDPCDPVFGMVSMPQAGETYAEYAAVPATDVIHKPDRLDHVTAASVPMVGHTAWRALFEAGGLTAGDRVLIHAGAGGVGHFAVQLAHETGAEVVTTASERNEEYLRGLGADKVVDYRRETFERVVEPVDLAIDAIGGDVLERSAEVVRDGGDLVTLPVEPSSELVSRLREAHGVDMHWFSIEPDAARLAKIATRIESGTISPTVSNVYPLTAARAAHEASETGHVRGKLVLDVE